MMIDDERYRNLTTSIPFKHGPDGKLKPSPRAIVFREEITEWCRINLHQLPKVHWRGGHTTELTFANERDLALFKTAWY